MLTIVSLAVFFYVRLHKTNLHADVQWKETERERGRGGINIYDCHFERSNNARTFHQKIMPSRSIYFLPLEKSQFLPITIWMPIIQFRPSNADDNALRRRTLKIYIFSKTFNMVEKKKKKYIEQALKLRFQRQNNRSLWPLLSNRFGFTLHNGCGNKVKGKKNVSQRYMHAMNQYVEGKRKNQASGFIRYFASKLLSHCVRMYI